MRTTLMKQDTLESTGGEEKQSMIFDGIGDLRRLMQKIT